MDTTCLVGTDIASFLLYEPEALQHRAQAPWGWFSDFGAQGGDLGELTVPERIDGRLVLIETAIPYYNEETNQTHWMGSDGEYTFRCTTGDLTSEEASREYPEMRDRRVVETIRVTRERLLLDGGYVVPFDHTPDTSGPYTGVPFDHISMEMALERGLAAWLFLPNGTYRVTAHHLAPSDDDDGGGNEATIVLAFALASP
jgi:hypothetical protein